MIFTIFAELLYSMSLTEIDILSIEVEDLKPPTGLCYIICNLKYIIGHSNIQIVFFIYYPDIINFVSCIFTNVQAGFLTTIFTNFDKAVFF